jgi:general secretion pathway protein J
MTRRRSSFGFTLVELMVALFAMALLAIMSWRGLDGMARARAQTEARSDEVLTLQIGLAQWAADLDAMMQLPNITAIEWNGRVLRITRQGSASPGAGVVVAAWGRRAVNGVDTWLRWQSAECTTREQLAQAWHDADIWSQNAGEEQRRGEVAVSPLEDWQIFFFRGGAWTNPMSSSATTQTVGTPPAGLGAVPTTTAVIPDGVRLVLLLPPGQAISGRLTRDWARPTLGGGKS